MSDELDSFIASLRKSQVKIVTKRYKEVSEAKEKLAKFGAITSTDFCDFGSDDALTLAAVHCGVLEKKSENYADWKFAPGIKEAVEELTK